MTADFVFVARFISSDRQRIIFIMNISVFGAVAKVKGKIIGFEASRFL
jgi:hypothetical protein